MDVKVFDTSRSGDRIALVTDGRFPGATRGFSSDHVGPETVDCGPIALIEDGDMIEIDAENGKLSLDLPENELLRRRNAWTLPKNDYTSGAIWKYAQQVGPARFGAVAHKDASVEVVCYADS